MGVKGVTTANRILDTAFKLFSERGYVAVTMKDISLAVPISRGGLYRYFASTEEIFSQIISREQNSALSSLNKAKEGEVAPEKILNVYLKHRIDSILNSSYGIDNAIMEFAANSCKGKELAVKRAADCIDIISQLIILGNEAGTFNCSNPQATARTISWIVEGMSKHSALCKVSEEEIEEQMKHICDILLYKN